MLIYALLSSTIGTYCPDLCKKHLTSKTIGVIIIKNVQYGGDSMALSTIDRVREAEQKSNDRLTQAEAEAERIVTEAQQNAAQLIEKAKQQAADFENKAAVEAQSRAADIVQQRKSAALEEADALSEKTLKLKQKVIDKLIIETLS